MRAAFISQPLILIVNLAETLMLNIKNSLRKYYDGTIFYTSDMNEVILWAETFALPFIFWKLLLDQFSSAKPPKHIIRLYSIQVSLAFHGGQVLDNSE